MTYQEWKKQTSKMIASVDKFFKPKELQILMDFMATVREEDFNLERRILIKNNLMTPYEQLKQAIQKANPEIMELPEYPYNPDAAKAVVELQRLSNLRHWDETIQKTASMMIKNYEEQRRNDYIAMLEQRYSGRPIRLADVLLAIRNKGKMLCVFDNGEFREMPDGSALHDSSYPFWNLKDDNLDHQSKETKQFLINLLI